MCEDHSPYAEPQSERRLKGTQRPIMARTLLEKVIREAKELGIREVIPSTMGEPLLYPHFERILELCNELNLKLNLTTNGTFPAPVKNRNVEYWAKKITPIGSDVKISWNGATKATQEAIMRGSNYDQLLNNARRFIEMRNQVFQESGNYCSMTMQLTFMSKNLVEVSEMVRLAIDLGFDRVKGHQLWTHFSQIETLSLRKDKASIKAWNETVEVCHQIARDNPMNSGKVIKLENFYPLESAHFNELSNHNTCPFLGKEIWVDPTGQFNVCCAPDRKRASLGDFGNLNRSGLKEVWNGSVYRDLCQNYMLNDLCKSCLMRRPKDNLC
jgi:MoaA/NifB/PqqE/SkfB family radical SAM enzyme